MRITLALLLSAPPPPCCCTRWKQRDRAGVQVEASPRPRPCSNKRPSFLGLGSDRRRRRSAMIMVTVPSFKPHARLHSSIHCSAVTGALTRHVLTSTLLLPAARIGVQPSFQVRPATAAVDEVWCSSAPLLLVITTWYCGRAGEARLSSLFPPSRWGCC
ncbi:unnamed protein product [Ectocarpus sp. 12 AP-2014]